MTHTVCIKSESMNEVLDPDDVRPQPPGGPPADAHVAGEAGLAHVATASFLASRVAPTGGFAIALAGGLALARVAERRGLRTGFGASLAAMLQTVALIGPARFAIPLTQALSAPVLGRLHALGTSVAGQLGACIAIRFADQIVVTSFYIWVIVGGLEPYADAYDALADRIPGVPAGQAAVLALTGAGLLAWTMFASTVQVLVYRRGLRGWPRDADPPAAAVQPAAPTPPAAEPRPRSPSGPRFDPRAVAVAAVIAFCALVASTAWPLLAAVGAWLALAWALARGDREPVRTGLALAALLGGGALVFGVVGGAEVELTLQRALRATLLVLVATWLRAAAGEEGLREVARRSLRRLRRLPAMREAATILDRLGAAGGLAASGRSLVAAVRHQPRRPAPLAGAVLGWIASEATHFTAPGSAPRSQLALRFPDGLLVAGAVLASAALALPVI